MTFNIHAKFLYTFKKIGYDDMRGKIAKYPNLCANIEPIFLIFPSSFIYDGIWLAGWLVGVVAYQPL